jgi:hypothetical protein
MIFVTLWYFIGLLSAAYPVKFDLKKIQEQKGFFLTCALFGPILILFILFDSNFD